MNYKKDFPIFNHNPWLVFFDGGASVQKPKVVIDGVSDFVAQDYANIHRWMYDLSERSEKMYHDSKEAVARLLGWCKASEIFYTYNSTYGINIVAQALVRSEFLKKGDVVLLGIWEHHANVLPWQILSEMFGFEIKFVGITDEYDIDWNDFDKKYDHNVKVVAMSHVSNVTGMIYDMKAVHQKLRESTFFLVDGSQSLPHFAVHVEEISCDCLVFTGHKMMAYTGIGAVYLKKEWMKNLNPMVAGGGTVEDVSVTGHRLASGTDKWEAGTPNIVWAASLLYAIEYIESLGGLEAISQHESELTAYALKKFHTLEKSGKISLIWPKQSEKRVGVFSFVLSDSKNFQVIGEKFAEHNIAIRCGGHCAYPLHKSLNVQWTCRMSMYIYNDKADVDKFFEVLEKIV